MIRDAEGGGQGGPWPPPPVFGRSDNPISTRGDYAHLITTDPPIFVRCAESLEIDLTRTQINRKSNKNNGEQQKGRGEKN